MLLLAAVALAVVAPVTAVAGVRSPSLAASITHSGSFSGVAATSASNAWAVGNTSGGRTMILHWNGTAWTHQSSPNIEGAFQAVAATSARNAWAVGCSGCLAGGAGDPLIERWNGTTWKKVPAPSVTALAGLYGVTAISPANAWAVGTPTGDPGHTTGIYASASG
jgi:hypothetical protein